MKHLLSILLTFVIIGSMACSGGQSVVEKEVEKEIKEEITVPTDYKCTSKETTDFTTVLSHLPNKCEIVAVTTDKGISTLADFLYLTMDKGDKCGENYDRQTYSDQDFTKQQTIIRYNSLDTTAKSISGLSSGVRITDSSDKDRYEIEYFLNDSFGHVEKYAFCLEEEKVVDESTDVTRDMDDTDIDSQHTRSDDRGVIIAGEFKSMEDLDKFKDKLLDRLEDKLEKDILDKLISKAAMVSDNIAPVTCLPIANDAMENLFCYNELAFAIGKTSLALSSAELMTLKSDESVLTNKAIARGINYSSSPDVRLVHIKQDKEKSNKIESMGGIHLSSSCIEAKSEFNGEELATIVGKFSPMVFAGFVNVIKESQKEEEISDDQVQDFTRDTYSKEPNVYDPSQVDMQGGQDFKDQIDGSLNAPLDFE